MEGVEMYYFAGGFVYDKDEKVILLHRRDSKAAVNPNKWAFFGGGNEEVDCNDSLSTFIREFYEETELSFSPKIVLPLRSYINLRTNRYRFIYYVEMKKSEVKIQLNEGAAFGWFNLEQISRLPITERTRDDLDFFSDCLEES